MRYYSKSTGCTYLSGVHQAWPDDAVEISEATYLAVIANPPEGKVRSHGKTGEPILIDSSPFAADVPALIAAERYEHETAGIVFDGMRVKTDDRSKNLIYLKAFRVMRNPNEEFRWKTPEGFVDLQANQLLAIADAVSDHVQQCINREDELLKALAEGTYADSMLKEGWPI